MSVRVHTAAAALARLWLVPTAPPFAERAAAWRPDPLGAWCDRCGMSVGPHEENEFGCAACRGTTPPWDRAVRLGEHADELRRWVHEIKFTRFRALGARLGRELGCQLRRAGCPSRGAVVCPMPMAYRHRVARGIDHAAAISGGVARELGCPSARLLTRSHRPSQVTVPASSRRRNIAGAFQRTRRAVPAGATVILIDDVLTTGSTARAACRALRGRPMRGPRPGSVWVATLAVAARPGAATEPNR